MPVEDDKELKRAAEALSSMQQCYRAAFASTAVDFIMALVSSDVISGQSPTLEECVDLADSANLLFFGIGLLRVSRTYDASIKSNKDLTIEAVTDVARTMAGIWLTSALAVGAISASSSLPLSKFIPASEYSGPIGIVALALAGSVTLSIMCARRAKELITTAEEKSHRKGGEIEKQHRSQIELYGKARQMGLLATRNMSYCMGSFALLGLVHFMVSFVTNPLLSLEFGLGLVDVWGDFKTAGLLLTLNQCFVRVVIEVTSFRESSNAELVDRGLYSELYEAQKGVYSRIAEIVNFATVFRFVPFLYTGAKSALEQYL